MLELLQRITAINSYAKDCHYNFQTYGQHQLADVNQENLLEYKDLINEVCYLGLGMDAPESEEVLEGALKFIPEVSEDDQVNLARLKLLIKMTLIHIEEMKLETRGIENLVGAIAQDLQQLHGLLYKVVDDEEDIKYLEKLQNAEDDKEKDDVSWITVKGNHIPVKEGQTKEEAVKEFIEKKEKSSKNDDMYDKMFTKDVMSSLYSAVKAQSYQAEEDGRKPKVGDTIIDSDRIISLFSSKLSTEEYNNKYSWDKAEDILFSKLNEIEREYGFEEEKAENQSESEDYKYIVPEGM